MARRFGLLAPFGEYTPGRFATVAPILTQRASVAQRGQEAALQAELARERMAQEGAQFGQTFGLKERQFTAAQEASALQAELDRAAAARADRDLALRRELGLGGLDIQRGQLDVSRGGLDVSRGNLDVSRGRLEEDIRAAGEREAAAERAEERAEERARREEAARLARQKREGRKEKYEQARQRRLDEANLERSRLQIRAAEMELAQARKAARRAPKDAIAARRAAEAEIDLNRATAEGRRAQAERDIATARSIEAETERGPQVEPRDPREIQAQDEVEAVFYGTVNKAATDLAVKGNLVSDSGLLTREAQIVIDEAIRDSIGRNISPAEVAQGFLAPGSPIMAHIEAIYEDRIFSAQTAQFPMGVDRFAQIEASTQRAQAHAHLRDTIAASLYRVGFDEEAVARTLPSPEPAGGARGPGIYRRTPGPIGKYAAPASR